MLKLISLIGLVVIFVGCNSGSVIYKPQPPDTIRTLAIYKVSELRYDVLYRIGKDSMMFVDKDENTKKKQMGRWLDYYYPVPKVKMDSAGKPAVDKAGKNIYYTSYDPLPKENLIKDFNINIDSLVKIHSPQK